MTREELFRYCLEEFGISPDYPWKKNPDFAVLRHDNNNKWFAIVMDIPVSKLGVDREKISDVVNVKYSEEMFVAFGRPKGVYPAYHMNKNHWVSLLLEEARDDTVKLLIDESFDLTKGNYK